MPILAVIPARMAATRLPGKPLARIGGQTLVERVYRAALASGVFDEVIVATDAPEVLAEISRVGGKAELTRDDHASGTDRVAEVAGRHPEFDVIANVQGDLVDPDIRLLQGVVQPFADHAGVEMTTVAVPMSPDLLDDPNSVKVVCAANGDALYFSRSTIPHGADAALHHLGLYAFRRDVLERYSDLPEGQLEVVERLEQLRALEAGIRIKVQVVEAEAVQEVNTPEDLAAAQDRLDA